MTDNERFFIVYEELKSKGKLNSYVELSAVLGTNKAGVYDLKQGKKKLSIDNIRSMKNSYHQINVDYILTEIGSPLLSENENKGVGDPEKINNAKIHDAPPIPVYSSAATASEVEVYNDLQNEGPAFYVSIPQFRDCKFGKIIYGHSMYPTVTSGSYVFCKPVLNKRSFLPGEIYYIEYDNFGVCKRLQKGQNKDEVLLVSDNDEIRTDGTRRYENFVLKIDDIRNI